MQKKAVMFWSGGKDSAFALYKVLHGKEYQVQYLITTVHSEYGRISMHGVRKELALLQAASIDLPLKIMYVMEGSNAEYENELQKLFAELKAEGITHVIYGDIFLEDLRSYRDALLAKAGMRGVYPLWKNDTCGLMKEFFRLGFRSITCCVSDAFFGEKDAGKELSPEFIAKLPAAVDPCGENGEFHSFCFAGPVFRKEVTIRTGEKVYRKMEMNTAGDSGQKGFWYCDLLPLSRS